MTADLSTSGRILAVVTNLMLESRITEGARALGYAVTTAGSTQDVREALRSHSVDLIVLDLQAAGIPWKDVVMAAREVATGHLPILAFGQHTKPDLLQAARDGGCDVVVPRSRLVEQFPALIEQTLGKTI